MHSFDTRARAGARAALAIMAVVLVAGCAATVNQTQPGSDGSVLAAPPKPLQIPVEATRRVVLNVQASPNYKQDAGWQAFKQEWIDITRERAIAQGFAFATQDGEPQPGAEPGTLLVVRINDYRHVGVGARVMFGILTGNAFIDTTMQFRDLTNGTVFGERAYNTSSSAGQGVFSAVTPKQIYALADLALAEIKRR